MRKTLGWLVPLCAVIGLLIAGGWYGQQRFAQHYSLYWIKTGSMAPTIKVHSLVVVRKHSYKPRQVITFEVEGQVVTHRLRGFRSDGTTVTKGDGNPSVDPWHVPKSAIVGHAVLAIYFGRLFSWLGAVLGLAVLCLVTCILWPDKRRESKPVPVAVR